MSIRYWYVQYKRRGLSPQEAWHEAKQRQASEDEQHERMTRKGYGRFPGTGPEAARFRDIGEIELANQRAGHYWFSPETKRFFKSRVLPEVHGGHFFISSEKPPHGPREYKIRRVDRRGHIHTVGGRKGVDYRAPTYSSPAAARTAIKRIMKTTKTRRSR